MPHQFFRNSLSNTFAYRLRSLRHPSQLSKLVSLLARYSRTGVNTWCVAGEMWPTGMAGRGPGLLNTCKINDPLPSAHLSELVRALMVGFVAKWQVVWLIGRLHGLLMAFMAYWQWYSLCKAPSLLAEEHLVRGIAYWPSTWPLHHVCGLVAGYIISVALGLLAECVPEGLVASLVATAMECGSLCFWPVWGHGCKDASRDPITHLPMWSKSNLCTYLNIPHGNISF